MSSTYSINIGTSTEADRLATIFDILNKLPDNIVKEINPHDLRDAVYSINETSIFKQTTGSSSSIEYVGISDDNTSPIENTIYFGKRSILGSNIMSNTLLTSSQSADVYFFNTKSDYNLSSQDTKISILAGTDTSLYSKAPYINSRIATGMSSSNVIQLQIGNNSGNINLYSLNERVKINGLGLPKISETIASASNNSILIYDSVSKSMYWQLNTLSTSNVGVTGSTSSILGNPVLVNGYDIELTDNRPIISSVGSIKPGMIFNNASIVDVVREMLYSYIPPTCSLTANPSISEKGNIGTPIIVGWSIHKRTDPILSALFSSGNVIGYSSPAPINSPGSIIVQSPPYVLGISPATFSTTYTFVVKDSGISNGGVPSTATSSVSVRLVYPYFWGVNSIDATNPSQVNAVIGTLNKVVEDKSNKQAALSGNGYIYFIYPVSSGGATYGYLSSIIDDMGATVSPSSYTYSIYSGPGITSPSSYWSNVSYYVYKIGSASGSTINVGTNPVTWLFNY